MKEYIDMVYVIITLRARFAKSASPEVLATPGWIVDPRQSATVQRPVDGGGCGTKTRCL